MSNRKTKEEFIHDAVNVHSNRYDYSLVNYTNNYSIIIIICKIHGEFTQTPKNHLNRKQGCPDCAGNKRKSNSNFVIEATKIHNNLYDYDKVDYISNKTNVIITCRIHGDFKQTPDGHLNQKQGCSECSGNKRKSNSEFITEGNKIHNNLYDYSLVEYVSNEKEVIIICKIHGEFMQIPRNHLNKKQGCPVCKLSKGELKILKFLENNNIKYIKEKRFKDCKFKRPLPFDFYLLDYNICIEYDGKQHFKPVDYFGGYDKFKLLKYKDSIKNSYCKNNNIFLLRIPYYNYKNIDIILREKLFDNL